MSGFFGRKKVESVSPVENSDNVDVQSVKFATEVLELEENLAISPDTPTVQRLIELYSTAIGHYEFLHDPKHFYYQEKLHSMLERSEILEVIGGSGTPKKANSPNFVSQKKEVLQARQKELSQKYTSTYSVELLQERNLEKLVRNHFAADSDTSTRLSENIRDQCIGLQERMRKRRTKKVPIFEDALEELMFKYADMKKAAKKRIKKSSTDPESVHRAIQDEFQRLDSLKKAEISKLKSSHKIIG